MRRSVKITAWILVAIIVAIVVAYIPKASKVTESRERNALIKAREEVDPNQRIAKLDEFLKTHPKSIYRGYAHVYVFDSYLDDLKDTTKAVSYAREVLASGESQESKGPLYPVLFSFWRETGKPDEARAIAREALDLNLKDASVYSDMAYELAAAGEQLDLSIELAQRAVDVADTDINRSYAYNALGWAYTQTGRPAEALEALRKSVKLAGEDVDEEVLRHLAEAELAAGKTEEAIATYLDMMARGQFDDVRAVLDSLYMKTRGSIATLDQDIKALREKRMSPATQFALRDAKGATKSLSDYKGKVVLLDFMQPT